MTDITQWIAAEETAKTQGAKGLGVGLPVMALSLGALGVIGGLVTVSNADLYINSSELRNLGWTLVAVSIVQAMLIAALGFGLQHVRSIATSNARLVQLLEEISASNARTVELLDDAVGYQQGG
jgi:hypothetical protein